MGQESALYLASRETAAPFGPIECFVEQRLSGRKEGDDYLRVRIEPAIIDQPYGLGDKNIEDVVLATRYAGSTLHPVNEWPMVVFVCRIVNENIRGAGQASARDLEVILIGELYQTLGAAQEAIGHEEHRIQY